jgi:hypothetical protein
MFETSGCRVGWLVLIWTESVAALGIIAFFFRLAMTAAGLTSRRNPQAIWRRYRRAMSFERDFVSDLMLEAHAVDRERHMSIHRFLAL